MMSGRNAFYPLALLFLICQLTSLTLTTNELENDKLQCRPPVAQVIHLSELDDVVTFEREGVTDYNRVVVDEANSQLIVGARDNLYRLSLADLTILEAAEWQADVEAVEECQLKGKSEEDCRNFIRVLLPWGNSLFVCGTYAFAPQCGWRNITGLSHVSSSVHGTSKCPYNPNHNNTALISSSGDIYSGTVTDFTARDPVIKRVYGNLPTLRTVQSNSKWLSGMLLYCPWYLHDNSVKQVQSYYRP